jgi:hypothetical protein
MSSVLVDHVDRRAIQYCVRSASQIAAKIMLKTHRKPPGAIQQQANVRVVTTRHRRVIECVLSGHQGGIATSAEGQRGMSVSCGVASHSRYHNRVLHSSLAFFILPLLPGAKLLAFETCTMPEMKDLQVSSHAMVQTSVCVLLISSKAHSILQQPTRVAVLVRGNSRYREEPDSVIIEHALSILDIPGTKTLYLAREDWGRTVQLVFDVFHDSYNFHDAHKAHDITVVIVSLGGRNEKHFYASLPQEEEVNGAIAKLHNLNGWEVRPPYFATHAQGKVPEYDNPRDVEMLST